MGAGKARALSNRAQMASSILNDLEQQAACKIEMNDFGMNWNEESVNLNLFEELEEIEYTPPASPTKRSYISSQVLPAAHQSSHLQPIHLLNSQASQSSADISALTAEFQAILDSLPKDNTEALSHALEIAGIPTTIIDGEALVPVELDLHPDLQSLEMDLDDLNVHAISENDDVIEESELYGMSDMSNQGSPASSVHSVYELVEEVDEHSEAAQKILDALLLGDVATAETFLPVIDNDESSMGSNEDSFQLQEYPRVQYAGRSSTGAVDDKKPERRGRKPGKKLSKKSPAYVKDKTIRKKEQNKTAATRYRQKKKMEFAIILDSEEQLQNEHNDLQKKKENLDKEILMVKQLLRDVIRAKKPSYPAAKPTVTGGKLTVSSIIGRNRRK